MTVEVKKLRGRPRVFDMDEALDKALKIFWEKGYEGASLAEFTVTLGINKPSLYAAFGNKEELFQKALSKYTLGPASFVKEIISEPTAFKVAQSFLFKAADFLTSTSHPKGCMVVQAAISIGDNSSRVKNLLIKYRLNYEQLLSVRFEKAVIDGDLTEGAKPKLLAKYLATLHQGMSIQATSGATKEELLEIAKLALEKWPNKK
jgi:AcrR family transcriptional regulator